MNTILAMAPPISFGTRLAVACFGFALGCLLYRLISGRCPAFRRSIVCLCLTAILAAGMFMDGRGLFAFVAGAILGTLADSRPLPMWNLKQSKVHLWRLVAACIGAGQLLGVGLLGVLYTFEDISPLDRLNHLMMFLAVGSFAGLVAGGIVSFAIARARHHAEHQGGEPELPVTLK